MPERSPAEERQRAVIDFLSDAANWPDGTRAVERVETHISVVFLGRRLALKMKKAVRLPYVDLSRPALRERDCRREVEVNRLFSPQLYLGTSRVTRERDGALALDGAGEAVEWLVRMRRFEEEDILSEVARRGPLGGPLVRALARVVAESHGRAPRREAEGPAIIARTVSQLRESLLARAQGALRERAEGLLARIEELAQAHEELLRERGAQGFVRRCHGDLHLGNIVLWRGEPALFDALEFSEELATVDILHDLAFLLMDLVHRGQQAAANRLMNWWLQFRWPEENHGALGLVGLFCACRAAIRAMVALDLATQKAEGEERAGLTERASAYLETAHACAAPVRPKIVAIGGPSGSGKTTLAAALAPLLAPGPGAAHIRSDVTRKLLAGVDEFARLPPEAYTRERSDAVYRHIIDEAARTARSGWVAVVDAVFLKAAERRAIEAAARDAGADFAGLWLEAPEATLKRRVSARVKDASDATAAVVEMQLPRAQAPEGWRLVPAGGEPGATLRAAREALF